MTDCNLDIAHFPRCKSRQVQADFSGGDITSNAGVLLLRELDRKLQLSKALSKIINDPRDPARCLHKTEAVVRQRLYGLALGYEDLNDHQQLRHDLALQTAVDTEHLLASQSTLCRFEKHASREQAVQMHKVLVEQFIASYRQPPKRLTLDFDATDDPVHGNQIGRYFSGYYDHYCFLPLYVFCGQKLLVSYLRPANVDAAKHAWAILALLVKRLRQEWPDVKILFRGDSGFCRHHIMSWCERNKVDYIVGIGTNSRLNKISLNTRYRAAMQFKDTGKKQRCFATLHYAAGTWKNRMRKVCVKAEFSERGDNTRYVVTNLKGAAKWLYDRRYCLRGDMENRIKEQQWLFSDRTSCHQWWPNQFRLLLSGMAYVLLEHLRSGYLKRTVFARAQMPTLREHLLKIGAVIIRNTRRIKIHMSSSFPHQKLYLDLARQLSPG